MTILLPKGLPAAETLRGEGIAVEESGTPMRSVPLRIGLVNLMPRKEASELAFARFLAQSGRNIELVLIVPAGYQPRNASGEHLDRYYRRWPAMRGEALDGLIVTGAPVEKLPFEQVAYWSEIREIFTWAKDRVGTSLYVCWAAQGALHAFRGVPKEPLPNKTFGVFTQRIRAPGSSLVRGMGTHYPIPVSRHSTVAEDAVAGSGAVVVAGSTETGPSIVEDRENRAVLIFDHFEYDEDTLSLEYERDRAAGKPIEPPCGPQAGAPWRPFASLFSRNWLDRASARANATGQQERALDWLFEDSAGSDRSPRPPAFVLQAAPRRHLLAEALATLASTNCYPSKARLHPDGEFASVQIELEDFAPALTEDIARSLLRMAGANRVFYRLPDGSGGVLQPAAERPRAACAA